MLTRQRIGNLYEHSWAKKQKEECMEGYQYLAGADLNAANYALVFKSDAEAPNKMFCQNLTYHVLII